MDKKLEKLQQARLRAREKGFTLVELAIVLVIIGLIIGGVLVGQDLIKAAEIRATITQIEQYNAAVNTFRTRFNGVPGDIRNITNFYAVGDFPDIRNGNGNKQIEQCVAAGAASGLCGSYATAGSYEAVDGTTTVGEIMQFWHHLSAAELVGGSFNGTGEGGAVADQAGALTFSFPASKLDRNGIGVYASGGKNYYQIGVKSQADATPAGSYAIDPSLTPEEAFNLDSKIDDGRPGTGSVTLRGSQINNIVDADILDGTDTDFANATPVTTACINEASVATGALLRAATYAIANTEIACSIRLRMN